MKNFNLEKTIWTEDDFKIMGWHDSYIHAISFNAKYEFLLDIDYIFEWIQPAEENNNFTFWISPCSLVFENVSNLKLDIEITEPFQLQIEDLIRHESNLKIDKAYINNNNQYLWEIQTMQGNITFNALGYKQFVRKKPKLHNEQLLDLDERGGISFDKFDKL